MNTVARSDWPTFRKTFCDKREKCKLGRHVRDWPDENRVRLPESCIGFYNPDVRGSILERYPVGSDAARVGYAIAKPRCERGKRRRKDGDHPRGAE